MNSLDRLLNPRSVAIIGASDDGARLSGRPLRYMLEAGFKGAIYPVNPSRQTVQGLRSYSSILDIPEALDVAIIAVAANLVITAVHECAKARVGTVILYSAGFAETGTAGMAEQQQILDICRASDMRLLGPNCLGVFNSKTGFFATFATSLDHGFPSAGRVAVVSQSGAYGQHLCHLAQRRDIGISYLITTGNEADIRFGEALHWAAGQPDIDIIMAYVEGVRDGAVFIAALAAAKAASKRMIVLKVGSSEAGSRAASSHTAALAGDDAIYDGIFRQYGVSRAHSMEHQLDIAYAWKLGRPQLRSGIGIATLSGGIGIHICDAIDAHALEAPEMPPHVQRELQKVIPFGSTVNPVDCTGQAVNELAVVTTVLETILQQDCYDCLIAYFGTVPLTRAVSGPLREAIAEGIRGHSDKLVVLCMSAEESIVRAYEDMGVLVFEDPARAIGAIAHMYDRRAHIPFREEVEKAHAPQHSPKGALSEFESGRILSEAGVPVVPQRLARTRDECISFAEEIGFPVALKVASAQILHKTDVGGVELNVASASAASLAFDNLCDRARQVPNAVLDGILVTAMAAPGLETIMGVVKDPTFGPMIMFGLGGTLVEMLQDVTFRAAPFGLEEAQAMINDIRHHNLLSGIRGAKPYDIEAIAMALSTLSTFALDENIESVDINPFVVWEAGKGGAALDALIVARE